MNDFAQLELETIARARAAIEPAPDDRVRIRLALAAQLAGVGALAAAPGVGAAHASAWRHFARSHWVALGSSASMLATVAFLAGYLVGHHSSSVVVRTVTVVAPSSAPGAAPTPSAEAQPVATSLALTDAGRGGARTRVASSATPPASTPGNSLSLELDLLQRAEHAIRAGEPLVALGLLRELDQKFPKGQLMQERTAARTMAHCQLEDAEQAQVRGRAYLQAHPRSVYADRVRSLCRLESSQGAKGSTSAGD